MTPVTPPLSRVGLTAGVALQCALLLALIAGALLHHPGLSQLAAVLSVIWVATQWARLIPLARLFVALAAAGFGLVMVIWPEAAPKLVRALVQGSGFAGLMMVLGLLRQPVKRAEITRSAAEYLLGFRPRHRYGALQTGAQFMALMFNIGIIAMIGDLTQPVDGRDVRHDPARRAMVTAAMRGAALVSIWSPMSLGFAIVTAGLPRIEPMELIATAFAFTLVILILSALWPLLPPEASPPQDEPPARSPSGRPTALAQVLGASALLLALTITLHHLLDLSFTLAAVVILPVFSLIWLALESGQVQPFETRLRDALLALADLRSESALFLSANVIGAALSVAVQASPLWPLLSGGSFASLPTLLICLFAIPLAAALYLPNTILVVLAAQLLGPTLLGQSHALALGLTLCIGWALAICVNPISAMNLIVGRFCDVPAARVAHRWNIRFVAMTFALAALLISLIFYIGG